MSAPAAASAAERAHRRDFASDVFHDLSQPLTALQCSLELALVRDQTIEEFRASVEAAVHAGESLRQRLLLLRELSDAEDPGNTSPLPLDRLLQQLREDMLPLFETAGRSFELTCLSVKVAANEAKLTRGFFYLLEFLLRCASPSHGITMHGDRTSQQKVEIRIAGCEACIDAGSCDDLLEESCSSELEIARRTFRAVGGDLIWMTAAGLPGEWIVRLPCVS